MKTFTDTDEIRENTVGLLKALSMTSIPDLCGLTGEMVLLENCISEDEYDYYEFYLTGYAFLKSLLRARMRLKRTDPDNVHLAMLSSSITELRTQLKENNAYFRQLMQMDKDSAQFSVAIKILSGVILALIFVLSVSVFAGTWS